MRSAAGLVAALAFVVGPPLAWARLVPPLAGFGLFALGGIVALLVGLASLVQAVRGRGLTPGGGLALGVGIVLVALAVRGHGGPMINDFTTDVANPPAFRDAAKLRQNAGRDMGYPPAFAAQQQASCADLHPAQLRLPPDAALARALEVAGQMPGWSVRASDRAAGTIEAIATSRLFGFQDDIVIRVTPEGDGTSRVDMRSKSRDGKGDLGVNANRIRTYIAALESGS